MAPPLGRANRVDLNPEPSRPQAHAETRVADPGCSFVRSSWPLSTPSPADIRSSDIAPQKLCGDGPARRPRTTRSAPRTRPAPREEDSMDWRLTRYQWGSIRPWIDAREYRTLRGSTEAHHDYLSSSSPSTRFSFEFLTSSMQRTHPA